MDYWAPRADPRSPCCPCAVCCAGLPTRSETHGSEEEMVRSIIALPLHGGDAALSCSVQSAEMPRKVRDATHWLIPTVM